MLTLITQVQKRNKRIISLFRFLRNTNTDFQVDILYLPHYNQYIRAPLTPLQHFPNLLHWLSLMTVSNEETFMIILARSQRQKNNAVVPMPGVPLPRKETALSLKEAILSKDLNLFGDKHSWGSLPSSKTC